MKGKMYAPAIILAWLWMSSPVLGQEQAYWVTPFEGAAKTEVEVPSDLSLVKALNLVAERNPIMKSLGYRLESSRELVEQAGARLNPELETEIEDVGWDAPGLKESEISISLSQELELFGQPGARRKVASADLEVTHFKTRLVAFDLFLETRRRFYALAHAQEHYRLTTISVALADSIAGNISLRIEKGAALASELALAQLELQRVMLEQSEAEQELESARVSLASLWHGDGSGLNVTILPEPEPSVVLTRLPSIAAQIDSSRAVAMLTRQTLLLKAERDLAGIESRPGITFSGGYKRVEAYNSNSFIFGVALPLPLWDRNQGTRNSLSSELRALDAEMHQTRAETKKEIEIGILRLRQLFERHTVLDSVLLPTAEEAYRTLLEAYRAGRLLYTSLLEAERSLNELRFEHNDMLLSIQNQIIALEQITGVTLNNYTSEE
jgi:cobalt-zinc-cadmium efflux system outer membrane protein